MNKIFISYSHQDEAWKDRLVPHFSTLQKQGLLEVWHDREIEGGADWFQEIEKAAKSASMAILLITENFFKSTFIKEYEIPWLLERQEKELVRILPLIIEHCEWQQVDWLKRILAKPKDGRPLSTGTTDQIDAELRAFARETAELLSRDILKASSQATQPLPPDKTYLSRLPTTRRELFGREQELAILCNAWADPHTSILTLVAWGGVGKTALVNEWLNGMAKDNYRGAERVYGWSFYSQGTREDKQVSADEFLAHALAWFGDTASQQKSPWDKGVRLAELVRQQRTLLILDGMEPLQYPPSPMQGRLKDQGLQALLKELAHYNPGLCVMTTRVAVADLAHKEKASAKRIDLEHLSPEAGAQLLKSLNVTGTEAELRTAAAEFAGHALALNLLGSYLATVHDGEIRKRDLIPQMTEDEEHGGHARRVMESYERWLTGTPELDMLYVMGLFDRPVARGAIDALLAAPPIFGVTSNLQNLPPANLQYALRRLRDLHLLAEKDEHRPDTLDCHPLVHEHFGEKLRCQNPSAWKEAHSRLYEYHKNLPAKYLPDTLEEMEPLFATVAHGCQAKQHQQAFYDVYWERISRKGEAFVVMKLGAFGADLAALSNFFENSWSQPTATLPGDVKAAIISWIGFRLRALGRLVEAAKPMRTSVEDSVSQEKWSNAALNLGNLSELYLTLGEVAKAVAAAHQSVNYADRSEDDFEMLKQRCKLADALHQAGDLSAAEKLFREAEAMQQQRQPDYRYLYSLQSYRFCDLLLSQGQVAEVLQRASRTLEWAKQYFGLLDVALDKLSLGRAHLLQATDRSLAATGQYKLAEDFLNQALTGLRESGTEHHIPRGLFARATLHRAQSEFAKAWADLEETREIAERGEMNLHLADYHLEACRLCLAEQKENSKQQKENGKLQEAKGHLHTAAEMIEKMGYGRRKPEVEALRHEIEALKI
jgi:tetratricopeptide (TPR) repeat protein